MWIQWDDTKHHKTDSGMNILHEKNLEKTDASQGVYALTNKFGGFNSVRYF